MKSLKLVLLIFICLNFHFSSQAQSDEELLKATLTDYMEGGTQGDTARLARAFHPIAQMKGFREGKLVLTPIKDYLSRAKPGVKQNRTTKIVSFDIQGIAATAKLELEYDTFKFIDYFNLLKVDGRWYIVDKIFYREEKKKG